MDQIDDDRVRYWNLDDSHDAHNAPDSVTVCRNYAVRMLVSTDWVTYIHQGDKWDALPNASLWVLSQRPETDILITRTGKKKDKPSQKSFRASTMIHKRALLEKYGFWKACPDRDWEMFQRWCGHGATWAFV